LTAKAKSIVILSEIPDELPFAMIDTRRLSQVVDNLITNAVKFSPKNTTVKLKAEKIEDEIKVSVIDQGQGIPETELPKLFREFGKTSVRPTDGEKSTGLGLAIVKKIVTGHGGKVGVTSKVGQGSTFFLTLPVAASVIEKQKTINA
jgi:signal transduction histidine kinase